MRQYTSQNQPRPLFTAPIHSLITLDRSNGMPLYRQICQQLREAILSGELAEGIRLPTERSLASELGVNRTTVMNAYNELASEGLIEGHVGRGTLVRPNHFGYNGDSFENETASWLLGLPAGEREILGPDAFMLSELTSSSEHKDIISLAICSALSLLMVCSLPVRAHLAILLSRVYAVSAQVLPHQCVSEVWLLMRSTSWSSPALHRVLA